MTQIRRLAARFLDVLADAFVGASPYYGSFTVLRAFGMGGPLPYRYPRHMEDER